MLTSEGTKSDILTALTIRKPEWLAIKGKLEASVTLIMKVTSQIHSMANTERLFLRASSFHHP